MVMVRGNVRKHSRAAFVFLLMYSSILDEMEARVVVFFRTAARIEISFSLDFFAALFLCVI